MRVLRVVALASRTGKYGGPFDTALGQSALLGDEGHDVHVVAGAFTGDAPEERDNLTTFPVRHVLGLRSFVDVAGIQMLPALSGAARRAEIVHISIAREPVPVVAALIAIATRTPLVLGSRTACLRPDGVAPIASSMLLSFARSWQEHRGSSR